MVEEGSFLFKTPREIRTFCKMEDHGRRRNRHRKHFYLALPNLLTGSVWFKPLKTQSVKKGFISYFILVQLFLRPDFKKANPIKSNRLPHFVEVHTVLVITKRFYNQPSDHHCKAGFCIAFVHIVLAFCKQASCFSLHFSKKDNHDWIFMKFLVQ